MPEPTRVVGRRVAAFLLDGLLLWVVSITLFVVTADKVPSETISTSSSTLNLEVNDERWLLEGSSATLFGILVGVAWLLYLGVLPGLTGWTPGKLLAGVRVVGKDGGRIGAARGVVRSLTWVVDGFPYFLPGLTGFIVAQSTQRHQRVGDQIASSFVVRAGMAPEAEERHLPASASPASATAGWYADPRGEQRLRYWDGDNWTAHTAE
ncbi:hypothetical protein DSM112329_00328 [Paraconexibacter sp. AEG42_29]|uniref:RDD family protein n=1 Tax=Paraconexibacter sp. AEG42_29 TaxID=2997339 RepID=A0AAU7APE0_9ACTN